MLHCPSVAVTPHVLPGTGSRDSDWGRDISKVNYSPTTELLHPELLNPDYRTAPPLPCCLARVCSHRRDARAKAAPLQCMHAQHRTHPVHVSEAMLWCGLAETGGCRGARQRR